MMLRALREAHRARPSPAPRAGAVIARGEELLAACHQSRAEQPHPTMVALERAGIRARSATLYVTSLPADDAPEADRYADAVRAARVARVVFGCPRPGGHSSRIERRLRRAGVRVESGPCRAQAQECIADFTKHARHGLPYVTLKAAVTLDGKLATRAGDSKWITSQASRRHAHRLRAQCDAVLVGLGTVLADDPQLTVRLVRGLQPRRVVLDSRLRTPVSAALIASSKTATTPPTVLVHGPHASAAARRRLRSAGAELVQVPVDREGRVRLRAALVALGRRGILRVLVEGGAGVHGAFLDAALADEAAIFVAPKILGDARAISLADGRPKKLLAEAFELAAPQIKRLGPDVLFTGRLVAPKARKR